MRHFPWRREWQPAISRVPSSLGPPEPARDTGCPGMRGRARPLASPCVTAPQPRASRGGRSASSGLCSVPRAPIPLPPGSPSTAGRVAVSIVLPDRCRQGPEMVAFSAAGPRRGWLAPAAAMPRGQSRPARRQASKGGAERHFPQPRSFQLGYLGAEGHWLHGTHCQGSPPGCWHIPRSCPEHPAHGQGRGRVGSARTGSGCGTSPETVPVLVTRAAVPHHRHGLGSRGGPATVSGSASPSLASRRRRKRRRRGRGKVCGEMHASSSPAETQLNPAAPVTAHCPPPRAVTPKLPSTNAAAPPRGLLLLLSFKLHHQQGSLCRPPGPRHRARPWDSHVPGSGRSHGPSSPQLGRDGGEIPQERGAGAGVTSHVCCGREAVRAGDRTAQPRSF